MILFGGRSAVVTTYTPMPIRIISIVVIILVLNTTAGIVNTAFCANSWLVAIRIMSNSVSRGAATGTYLPMLISIMFITGVVFVPNVVARIVNAAFCTDIGIVAICGMRPFFGRSAATGACIPMLISVMLEGIIVIRVLNTTARVISATCCTATGLIAICEMSPFLGRSTATGTYQPMLISIMFITVIIFVTNAVARIVSTTFCADG